MQIGDLVKWKISGLEAAPDAIVVQLDEVGRMSADTACQVYFFKTKKTQWCYRDCLEVICSK